MSNSPMSEALKVKPLTARQWLMACLVVSALIPSIGHAQAASTSLTTLMAVESGLHWVGDGAVAIATVSDSRAATALASVRMEFRDPAGRLVAAATLPLGPGTPAYLRFQNKAGAGLRQLSLFVHVTGLADAGNAPVAVWEDISPAGSITLGGSCGPGGSPGGNQQMCQGWRFVLTPDQPQ